MMIMMPINDDDDNNHWWSCMTTNNDDDDDDARWLAPVSTLRVGRTGFTLGNWKSEISRKLLHPPRGIYRVRVYPGVCTAVMNRVRFNMFINNIYLPVRRVLLVSRSRFLIFDLNNFKEKNKSSGNLLSNLLTFHRFVDGRLHTLK